MPCDYTHARPLITTYLQHRRLRCLTDLTPVQLNELFDQLRFDPPPTTREAELRDKRNLIAWIQRNLPGLTHATGRRMGLKALLEGSWELREEEKREKEGNVVMGVRGWTASAIESGESLRSSSEAFSKSGAEDHCASAIDVDVGEEAGSPDPDDNDDDDCGWSDGAVASPLPPRHRNQPSRGLELTRSQAKVSRAGHNALDEPEMDADRHHTRLWPGVSQKKYNIKNSAQQPQPKADQESIRFQTHDISQADYDDHTVAPVPRPNLSQTRSSQAKLDIHQAVAPKPHPNLYQRGLPSDQTLRTARLDLDMRSDVLAQSRTLVGFQQQSSIDPKMAYARPRTPTESTSPDPLISASHTITSKLSSRMPPPKHFDDLISPQRQEPQPMPKPHIGSALVPRPGSSFTPSKDREITQTLPLARSSYARNVVQEDAIPSPFSSTCGDTSYDKIDNVDTGTASTDATDLTPPHQSTTARSSQVSSHRRTSSRPSRPTANASRQPIVPTHTPTRTRNNVTSRNMTTHPRQTKTASTRPSQPPHYNTTLHNITTSPSSSNNSVDPRHEDRLSALLAEAFEEVKTHCKEGEFGNAVLGLTRMISAVVLEQEQEQGMGRWS